MPPKLDTVRCGDREWWAFGKLFRSGNSHLPGLAVRSRTPAPRLTNLVIRRAGSVSLHIRQSLPRVSPRTRFTCSPVAPLVCTRCLPQFKSDWPPGLLLPDCCAIRRVPAGGDILDPDGDDVTAAKLTVDRQIEHGEVASAALDLEFCPDRPDVFGSQRWLCPGQLSLVPRHSFWRGTRIHLVLHGRTPRLDYRGEKHVPSH
jgi:hypothetical protein